MIWTEHRVVPLHDADGAVTSIAGIARDVTELKLKEAYLSHRALHDPLTGLPNRVLLLDRLEAELTRIRRHAAYLAVLYLDVDRFKTVNDNLGHESGDRLLQVVARRLRDTLRPSDSVARLGGDEFAAVLPDLGDPNEATQIAGRLLAAVAEPVDLGEGSLITTVSIGIAAAGDGGCQRGRAAPARRLRHVHGQGPRPGARRVVRRARAPRRDPRTRAANRRPDSLRRWPSSRRRTRTTASDRCAPWPPRCPAGWSTPRSARRSIRCPRSCSARSPTPRPAPPGTPRRSAAPRCATPPSAWIDRRFGCTVTADEVVACIGTKELVASLPRALSLRDPSRDTVLVPGGGLPDVRDGRAARGAAGGTGAGRRPLASRPRPASTRPMRRVRSCSGSTTRATRPVRPRHPARCVAAVEWARARGIIVASDECYAEFTYDADGEPAAPVTALTAGTDGVLAVHSLSKRSNMAGLRSGFVAGDRDLVGYLGEVRKHGGLMMPAPVQAATVAALGDDVHVAEQRARYARRRAIALPALEARGLVHDGGSSTFYLWLRDADEARDGWTIADDLADHRPRRRAGRLLRHRERRPRAGGADPHRRRRWIWWRSGRRPTSSLTPA